MDTLSAMVCRFRRNETSPIETGLLINEGQLIIDMSGMPVEAPIWNFWQEPIAGCLRITPLFTEN